MDIVVWIATAGADHHDEPEPAGGEGPVGCAAGLRQWIVKPIPIMKVSPSTVFANPVACPP